MNAAPLTSSMIGSEAPSAIARRPGAGDFRSLLARSTPVSSAEAREVAEKLVAEVFIEPVLTSLREHSRAAGPFAAGDAERRFGPMLDQHIADRVTRSARLPLVDEIARRLAAHTAHGKAADPIQETRRVALQA
jgi:Rod binding domain-containing protein